MRKGFWANSALSAWTINRNQMETIMELFIVFAILSACLCGFIAASKNRNSAAWAAGGALGGIFAIIAICAVPAIEPEPVTSDKE